MNNLKLTYQGDIALNLTPISSNFKRSDNINSLGEDFSFDLINNPLDPYMDLKDKIPAMGGKIIFENNGKTIFTGILKDKKRSGLSGHSYIAYDYGYFLNKDEIYKQFNGCSSSDAIKEICKLKNIPVDTIVDINVAIKHIYNGNTISDAIKDILKKATAENGINYRLEMRQNKLYIDKMSSLIVTATYKPAPNANEFNAALVPANFSASDSIQDMITKVVVTSEKRKDVQIVATAEDAEKTKTFGSLVHYEKVDHKKLGQAQTIANQKLKELSKVKQERSVKLFGDDGVRSGRTIVLALPDLDLVGNYLITNCTHEYSNINHFMTLKLKKEE